MSNNENINKEMVTHLFAEIKADLIAIHEQTKLTNGRVSELEKWRAYLVGMATVLALMVIPIFLQIAYRYISG